ncbi:MAG TPA: PAS domain-containing protein, partial [Ferruginibacter sp.]|nr:PAS domain-containing protein [Ferruginibacter sp.]
MTPGNILHRQAFDHSFQANIISTVSSGKIISANKAACKLLGYSKKELLTKTRENIFDINESSFKKMLKQRTAEGHSIAKVQVIKKSGKHIPCEITSALFTDKAGIEKSITTITDLSKSIRQQMHLDTRKDKITADNIVHAKSKQKNIDTKKAQRVAGDIVLAKSKQKNLDTKKAKIVADNIVIAKSKQKTIDTKKDKIVADNIVIAKSKQKSIDTKKDKRVSADIALAKSKQKSIDTKKDKIVAGNIAEVHARSNEWKKHAGKISYDVMWEWDVKTGKMYIGDSIEEVFGYVLKNNEISYSDFTRWLLPQEKMAVEKRISKVLDSRKNTWKDAFLLKRSDGSIAATTSRASIVRNEKGKAIRMIGTIQDISRIQELEILLSEQTALREEQSEKFLTASRLSFDVIWDWNLVTNEVFRGEGYEELFGYSMILNKGNIADWGNYIHPDDRVGVEKRLTKAISSSTAYWEDDYRFIRADGSIAKIFDRASIFRDTSGKAYRMIGSMHDISKQKVLEERLEWEIKLKEKQIAEATEDAKDTERSDIGKELHDNINQ